MASDTLKVFQNNNGATTSIPASYLSLYDYNDLATIGINNLTIGFTDSSRSSYQLLKKSIKDGFSATEDMTFLTTNFIYPSGSSLVFDPFVECGVYYIYKYTNDGSWTYSTSDGGDGSDIIPDYDGSFLMGINGTSFTQIKITYNENISSFIEQVKDSIVETIGATYPYVIRQAVTRYKKINFSGTVVSDMNYSNSFMSLVPNYYTAGITYANAVAAYNTFILNNKINYGQNYVLEKNFRENLISFLNNGKPKVLKTAADGMFMVRLTNLSFTPKQQLGRMIYDFSCDLTEIAPVNSVNIQSYLEL